MTVPAAPHPFRPGEAVWVELCTTDPAGAAHYYSELLGWTITEERLGSTIYRMCSLEGRHVAGISDAAAMHGGRLRGWITYFAVADIDATARQAVAGGGELVSEPRYLPDAGSGAAVIDPFGAVFGLYCGESRTGVEALNSLGALCWNELDTGEPAEAIAYYRNLFGFGTQRLESSRSQPYTVLTLDGDPVAGVLELDNEWPNLLPSRWIAYFAVESLESALAQVVDLGGTAGVGPVVSPHGRLQLARDPSGHSVCLIELEDGLRPTSFPSIPVETA